MKIFMHMMRSYIRPLAVLISCSLLFAACKKDSITGNTSQQPLSGLMAFNLAADNSSVGFSLSGSNLGNSPLGYTGYTGNYLAVYTGDREVRSFDYNTGSTLAISNASFRDSSYYSSFLLGVNGNYRNVTVEDKLLPLTALTGKAWVRYINAIPDSSVLPTVQITAGGDSPVSEPAAYATVSDFRQVTAGNITLAINNGTNIAATRTVALDENNIYTFLLTGIPGETDTTKAVQVRYIRNGTVTP